MASKTPSTNTRGRLQRELVVQTALDLMNQIGLDALSLRRLADELHVQAPALYWHFKNKQELLDEMAETMLLSVYPSTPESLAQMEWSEFLLMMGRTLRKALLSYRDGARLLASADVSRSSLVSVNLALGVLAGAGFSYQTALVGIMTVVNYTLGYTFEEQASLKRDDEEDYLRELVTAANLPHLTAAFQENVVPLDSEGEFEASLTLIIDGLMTRR